MSAIYQVHEPIIQSTIDIAEIEKQYNCRFIMETCINQTPDASKNWVNSPWLLFYGNGEPHPRGSKWLAFGENNGHFVVTDGQSVPNHKEGLAGYYNPETGEAVYSLYRHDFRYDRSKTFAVDGGRDYLKVVGTVPKGFLFGVFKVHGDDAEFTDKAGVYFHEVDVNHD